MGLCPSSSTCGLLTLLSVTVLMDHNQTLSECLSQSNTGQVRIWVISVKSLTGNRGAKARTILLTLMAAVLIHIS
jgi:hypothetical protein